jgi:hypothetical protein
MGRKANGTSGKTATKSRPKAERVARKSKLTRADEEHQRTVFFHHKNKLKDLYGGAEHIAGKIKEAFEIAKAAGVSKQDILIALKLEKDETKVATTFQATERVAKWMGYAIGSQLTLFAEDEAFEDGKRAGLQNQMRKPPENLGDAAQGRWFAGYSEGIKAYTAAFDNGFRGAATELAPLAELAEKVVEKARAAQH